MTISRSGSEGSLANVYIRGSKSGNVLILIDGVKISDPTVPGNLYNISGIMTSNIERIEIVKGAMSSIYGAEASGGVINIITKKGAGKKLTVTGEAGADKTFAESVSLSESTENGAFFFTGSHYKTDGISNAKKPAGSSGKYDNDNYKNTSASSKMSSNISDKASVNLSMNYTDSKTGIDDGSFEDDPNNIYTSSLFTSRAEFKHSPFKWWTYKGGVSYMSFARENVDPKDGVDTTENNVNTYNGSNSKIDFISIFKIAFDTLTFGADIIDERGRSTSSYYDTYILSDSLSIFPEKSITTKSLFLNDEISLFDMLYLKAGGRIDDHAVFGSHWTWDSSAAVVLPVIGTRLRTSAGTGFRAPSMSELYGMWGGNDQLKPEKTFVYDTGINQEFFNGDLSVDCTYFVQKYTDMIDYNGTTWKYYNADGEISNRGIEVSSAVKLGGILKISYGYTFFDYTKTAKTTILKRPAHKHSASVTLSPFTGLDITGNYLYVAKRYDYLTSTSNVRLDPYSKIDMNIRYSVNEMLTFTARGENITDADYMETYGYNTKGRSFYGGMELVL